MRSRVEESTSYPPARERKRVESRTYWRRVRTVYELHVETVAEAADAYDVTWLGGYRLDLPAQVDNVIVDGAIGQHHSVSPRCVEQLLTTQDPAGILHERGE